METIPIGQVVEFTLNLTKDLVVYFAPLIGVIAGLKFVADWIHKIIFGKKV